MPQEKEQNPTSSSLSFYVRSYENFWPADACVRLIERFETSSDKKIQQADGSFSFTQVDVSKTWPELHDEIARKLSVVFYRYQTELGVRQFWPARYFYENMRIKRYLPNGRDEFPPHVDVYNSASAARFMAVLLYLNEPEGGQTVFQNLGLSIAPQTGKLLIFPPHWTFPHAGLPPIASNKYILTTYLLYPPP
ncbi:MAG TPA: 2OG-Fe(II) oxygenase [Rhizomicrobium sp.]|nr:2OG-Fe(II) oxygenase [Rhizomicrobium sp.]